ncbi:MAG: hypothetical protein KatS3mg051_1919 [Anaerolineae bacterium]|nr:MAG: hypothetical protein KatS3mg051_1919 [Anaerolineae bacterium]
MANDVIEGYAQATMLAQDVVEATLSADLTDNELLAMCMHLCGITRDRDIARALDVTRQRAQQLRSNALYKVAAQLRKMGYDVEVGASCGRAGKNRGEANANAKLTETAVREIRTLAAQGAKRRELAERYGISVNTVGQVIRGEIWRHVNS